MKVKEMATTALENAPTAEKTVTTEENPGLHVSMKRAFEYISNKNFRELPNTATIHLSNGNEVNVTLAFGHVADTILPDGLKDNIMVAISRERWLNTTCLTEGITPLPSKRFNKNENKAIATYGAVSQGAETFEVDGEAYRIFGWLKYPVFMHRAVAFVKYGVHIIAMPAPAYAQFAKGQLLEDTTVMEVK